MARVPLQGGAYQAASLLASAQRCVNLYAEQNPPDSPFPFTYYPTPGLKLLFNTGDGGHIRLVYRDSKGNLYVVSGHRVYRLNPIGWRLTYVGSVNTVQGPMRATDNGVDIIFVDGSADGFILNIATQAWSQIDDPAWYGSQSADTVDTYMIFGWPGNGEMYTTLAQSTTFDASYFAAKSGAPDPVQAIAAVHKEIWLLGTDTTEVWFDAGNPNFPFERIPGVFIQQGVAAVWSVAKANENLFWIGRGEQGNAMPYMSQYYQAVPIGTPAIVDEWQTYARIDDATAFTYQIGSHVFYVVTFPTADRSWVYDVLTQQWHEWLSMDASGALHAHVSGSYCFTGSMHLLGDANSGNVYQLDVNTFTDNGAAIPRIRGFPHLSDFNSGARQFYKYFLANVEVGRGLSDGTTGAPPILLRWSDDGGYTWGQPIEGNLGAVGQSIRSVQWNRLGYARDRVFEVSWSANARSSLNGAYVSWEVGRS